MASAHVEALLPELLEAIFSFIPVRFRIRVVAFVCKRWRTTVLRTVKKLSCRRPAGSLEHFPFTSLTKLDLRPICAKEGHLQCPASVRELALPRFRGLSGKCMLDHLRDIPILTSINIQTTEHECPRTLAVLLESQATLRKIAFVNWRHSRNENAHIDLSMCPTRSLLLSQHFPALSELVLSFDTLPDLCTRHASQLTRLSISPGSQSAAWEFLRGASFPYLTHLELPAQPLVNNTGALAQCPKLCSISLLHVSAADLHVLCPLIARLEVSATVTSRVSTADCATLVTDLALLSKLTALSLITSRAGSELIAALRPAHASLTSLKLHLAHVSLDELAPFTRLKRLEVMDVTHFNAVLPSVSRLFVSNDQTRLGELGDCFPRMSKVFLTVEYPHGPGRRRALKSALRAMEQRGVRLIVLELALYAMSDKRKGFLQRLRDACQIAVLDVSIDDRTSETEESSREASDGE